MIRDHSSSRGARPDEVIEAVSAFVAAGRPEMDAEGRAESEFVASTASAIADWIGWCDTPGLMLDLNPWCELWQSIAAAGAGDLRDIAAESLAIERDHAAHLQAAADALGAVAGFRHTFGAGPAFPDVTAVARQRLVDSFARVVGSTPLDAGSVEGLAAAAEKACRKLKDAWARAEDEPFLGQVERTIEESSRVGRRFLRFSYFRFAAGQAVGEPLRVACLALIGLGEQRMYVDGGASQAAAIEAGRASVEALRIAARALRKSLRA